ncbi:MAG: imidazoleglycerol-phosphate dehydratase HisB [Armatimonadota bacterium]|nr:imidazoleglycerol-phosphate dehydratase HisB [Armatimonadota bacterium]MDR7450655.1 imidazoleglycerol-phosphate dehydratase HisB [Armatimonadota bacterium]MDR7466212.1 imidazoleglycerol-phosphate dehydratase HisB [Armatimonadota bacterium]MDR7492933.1 imidazoleglycerol-phosphate dehydratase HisB [Armatimonadota bacterium]MDR7498310.1 imidazoleglycerol-phosphate dehydratase HisB [Armatimonadota bacterium]
MTRRAEVERETAETSIRIRLDLDGGGDVSIRTGVPFFDHMLEQLGRHGRFDLQVEGRGDLEVDAHHTVEDVGIVLGQALRRALGTGEGIARFASLHAPMDDALVLAALDVSGRPFLRYDLALGPVRLGTFPADLGEEFFRAFTAHAAITLHLVRVAGRSAHHILEAAFKGTGVVLHRATRIVGGAIPSTKGVL